MCDFLKEPVSILMHVVSHEIVFPKTIPQSPIPADAINLICNQHAFLFETHYICPPNLTYLMSIFGIYI